MDILGITGILRDDGQLGFLLPAYECASSC